MSQYDFHPLADIFPLIEGREFDELVSDIKANGQHEEIVIYDGKILDGRNRYLACQSAGVDPRFVDYRGNDPVSYVISLNLKRRHLNESQRAMVAARLANLSWGGDRKPDQEANLPLEPEIPAITNTAAAKLLNVSERSVKTARSVRDNAAPELQRAVERGHVSVSAAADIASQPRERQREISAWSEKDILNAAKEIRTEKAKVKHAKRLEKIVELVEAEGDLPEDMKFPVLYADPPWRFEPYSRDTGMDRAADNHYPTMTIDKIKALPVPAHSDATLFLWATSPMLVEALEVMAAWGFTYKSQIVWVKDRIGTGYWARNKHELLLIGTKGSIPAPLPGTQPESAILAPLAEHSRKPEIFYEIIERIYPDLPKLEMFARNTREGWHGWGKEVGKFDQAAA